MSHEDLRHLLREFANSAGAYSVAIVRGGTSIRGGDEDMRVISTALGNETVLRAEFAESSNHRDLADERAAALERCARSLRSVARRLELSTLPELAYPPAAASTHERVLERIRSFLQALESCQGLINAAVLHRGEVVASAEPLERSHEERIPLLIRRVDAKAKEQPHSSHAELCDHDCFARSFYYDAHVVAFFDASYSEDFVRHRVQLVVREIAHLLQMLDEPPTGPAGIAPIPT